MFAMDKDSPLLLSNPGSLLSKFSAGGVRVMDVAAEISAGGDIFKAKHMKKQNSVSVERLKLMLHTVFTVPR